MRGAKQLTDRLRAGQGIVPAAVARLRDSGVTDEEIRRLFEAELAGRPPGKKVEDIVAEAFASRQPAWRSDTTTSRLSAA